MKTHTVRFSVLLAIATLFCTAGLQAQASRTSVYANVSVGFNAPSWSDVKGGFGVGTAFGVIVKDRHYIEAEVLYLKSDFDAPSNVSADLQQIPVLATYRYGIPLGANSGWNLQVGGSVGEALQKAKFSARYGNYTLSNSESQWVFAAGAQARISYKINNCVSVNADLRSIWVAKADFSNNSGTNTMATIGASFRF